jgi:NTE family protein
MAKSKKTATIINKDPKIINLALQGGGAHASFTWGVLDRLLDESKLSFEAICGTSGGAINGTLLAYGMLQGSRSEAKKLLEIFWKKVSSAASMTPLKPSMMDKLFDNKNLDFSPNFLMLDYITRMLSPYQLNLFGLNPLREIIGELVNFEELQKNSKIKIYVNATNVKTGKIKIFEQNKLTLDMLLASTCLPLFYQAVEIEGEFYWDGGYSGNPALFPIFYGCACSDIMIVQVNPFNIDEVPTSAQGIIDRLNEISFNSTLMREMRSIAFIKKLIDEERVDSSRYKNILVHLIGAEDIMISLGTSSKMNADWEFLTYLRDIGRQAADDWLVNNYNKIGVESSIDIRKMFLD